MSDEQHIGNDKSRYINAPKRTEVIHRSGLQGLKGQPRLKKLLHYTMGGSLRRNTSLFRRKRWNWKPQYTL